MDDRPYVLPLLSILVAAPCVASCGTDDTAPTAGSTGVASMPDPDASGAASSGMQSTTPVSTGTSGDTTGAESTGEPTTSGAETAAETTTDGCMPGTFDASQFGEACFQ